MTSRLEAEGEGDGGGKRRDGLVTGGGHGPLCSREAGDWAPGVGGWRRGLAPAPSPLLRSLRRAELCTARRGPSGPGLTWGPTVFDTCGHEFPELPGRLQP